jgi:xylulokinase
MLSAGLSLRWLRDLMGMTRISDAYERLAALAAAVPPGSDGLFFLPYLVGERSPLMDPHARGGFVGLTLHHELGHMARAIMEGVAFALRQIVGAMAELDSSLDAFYAVGGGLLGSPLWRQILADVLGRPLRLPALPEGAALGAAILGGIAGGVYTDYDQARQATALPFTMVLPDPSNAALYTQRFQQFVESYSLLAPIFHRL